MSEENRAKLREIGEGIDLRHITYEKLTELQDRIVKALDEAERCGAEKGFLEGQKQMRERTERTACHRLDCECRKRIRALPLGVSDSERPLEGLKDGSQ